MLKFFRRLILRRKLRVVIRTLPHLLRERHGAGEFYTTGQVETACSLLKVKASILPYALATACTSEAFALVDIGLARQNYEDLRKEIGALFDIDEHRLNCKGLLFEFRNPIGKNHGLGDLSRSGYDGGHPGA